MTLDLLFDILGIAGTSCVLFAYFLLQKGWASSTSYRYLFINLVGAGLLLVSLIWHRNLAALLLETAWCLITVYGITKRFHQDRLSAT